MANKKCTVRIYTYITLTFKEYYGLRLVESHERGEKHGCYIPHVEASLMKKGLIWINAREAGELELTNLGKQLLLNIECEGDFSEEWKYRASMAIDQHKQAYKPYSAK